MLKAETPELEVIIPAKNEAENLPELVNRLHLSLTAAKISYRSIIVDDYSTDNTVDIVNSLSQTYPILLVRKTTSPGKAQSIIEGSRHATAPMLAMIDADLEYEPEFLPSLYLAAQSSGVAVGNRTIQHKNRLRKFLSAANRQIIGRLLLGLNCDIQSGLKVFRSEIIRHLDTKNIDSWALDVPLLHTALELGWKIESVDIPFQPRRFGISKCASELTKATKQIMLSGIRTRLHPSKVYRLESEHEQIGHGIAHKRKRFITHNRLPTSVSAIYTATPQQKILFIGIAALVIVGISTNPLNTAIAFISIITLIYFFDVFFNLYLVIRSLHTPPELKFSDSQIKGLSLHKLPKYTILCPLYKEAAVLPDFVANIKLLNWPKSRLEIFLLLEEDDHQTIEAAQKIDLPPYFKTLVVPHSHPKTKPKACNYGLAHATGEFIVIYDAEDRPEPNQLKVAYLGFLNSSAQTVCLQAKLNYYNPNQNLLTRLFTAEYSLWFDVILPGLQSIRTSIPLGGTSNHFRTEILKSLHGWDAFNVTEDCDLGARLFKSGYTTAIIDSRTLEEANSNFFNWFRQRSRWIKGYMQTYLVHNRNPLNFVRDHGIHALIFQLVVGGKIAFMIINPILWVLTISYFVFRSTIGPTIESLFPQIIFYLAVVSLVFGNFLVMYYYMIGTAKTGQWRLVKYVFLIPFYWLAVSLAALKATRQLIFAPHFWEKTHHGLHLAKLPSINNHPIMTTTSLRPIRTPNRYAFLKPSTYLILSSLVASSINFMFSTWTSRTLGTTELGIMSLLGSLLIIGHLPAASLSRTLALKAGVMLGEYKRPIKNLWLHYAKQVVPWSFLLSGIWLAAIPLLADLFNLASYLPLFLLTPVWLVVLNSVIDSGYLSGSQRFVTLGLMLMVDSIVKFLSAAILVQTGHENFVYLSITLGLIASFLIGRVASHRISGTNISIAGNRQLSKKFFLSGLASRISTISFINLDILLAKKYLSPETAGEYALLSLVGNTVFFLGSLFSQLITPIASVQVKNKSNKYLDYILIACVSISSLAGFVVLGVFGYISAPLIFGPKANLIYQYLPAYTLAMAVVTISSAVVNLLQVKGRHVYTFSSIAAGLGLIILSWQNHSSIGDISLAVQISSGIFLLSIVLIWKFENTFNWTLRNTIDLLRVFSTNPDNTQFGSRRILVFNWRDTRHSQSGGAEVFIHQTASRWVRDGLHVTLFCGNDGKSPHHEIIDGIQIYRRGGFYTVYLWALIYYVLRFRGKFDHVIDASNGVPFFTPLYVRAPKTLIIHHVHQAVFDTNLPKHLKEVAGFVEKKLMPKLYKSIQIVTVSESSKQEILNLGFKSDHLINVVNPGVDSPLSTPAAKSKTPLFVYLGRIKKYKQIDVAIKAFELIQKNFPDSRLIIAGSGDYRNRLELLANGLGLKANVKFLGSVSEIEKWQLLGQSWASIQPSSAEGWGITVIEANAAGTPVIASDIPGLRDSVINQQTGLLVPSGSMPDLVNAMQEIITNKKLRYRLSKNASIWAQRFDWDLSAQKFKNIVTQTGNLGSKKIIYQAINIK